MPSRLGHRLYKKSDHLKNIFVVYSIIIIQQILKGLNTHQNIQVCFMIKISVGYLYNQSEGWDLALDSAYQVQIQSFDGMSSMLYHTIEHASVGLLKDSGR